MHIVREADVLLFGEKIGLIRQEKSGFYFTYLQNYHGIPLSLSLPVERQTFYSETLFPYFASLAPEGWLRTQYALHQKIDEDDLFGFLLNNGENLVGAVQISRKVK